MKCADSDKMVLEPLQEKHENLKFGVDSQGGAEAEAAAWEMSFENGREFC